jgi:serine/threonine protein kinase
VKRLTEFKGKQMVAYASPCDRDRLQRLLDDRLPESVQTEVTAHLETCRTCRLELESLAAAEIVWQDTREALSHVDDESPGPIAGDDHEETSLIPLEFLTPSDNPAMLGRMGEFEILELIGCGGMGIVLKGYDHELNRYIAVKVLHPHCATSAAARRRFAREAQAAAAVVHQHVVAIHAVGANHHPPYLVMAFVPGESLQQRLNREGSFEVVDVLRIGQQVAEGLAAAHAQGLVHRDIKPGNILLERNVDRVLLTDFGLARAADDASLTQSGVIAGTPQFMSPEQARGDNVDHRTDLFSLGTVMYTLLAGHSPFRSETAMGVLRRVCDDTPRPLRELNPAVPAWLEAFVARLQAKQPSDRFESASHVADLMKRSLAHLQQPTLVSLPEEVTRLVRHTKRRRVINGWTVALCATGVLIAISFYSLLDSNRSKERIRLQRDQQSTISAEGVIPWDDDFATEANSIRRSVDRLENESPDSF